MTTLAPARFWRDAPPYAALTLVIALSALPLIVALALDPRQFQADSVWIKPLKFHAALAIYTATLALYARWMPPETTASSFWRWHVRAVVASILAELLWVGAAATLGTASHFNTAPIWSAIYPLMGLLAIILTSATLVMGLAIRRNGALRPAFRLSLTLGLLLTFALTLITAGTMAGLPGHHIGTPLTGATVPLMGWSREVGDLRVSHFFASHALHALPLVGWATRSPAAVWLAATAYTAFVAATYLQALSGLPLI